MNPKVQEPVNRILSRVNNIILIDPLAYQDFIWLMNRSKIIITDSGGIQEEAPSLGKPVLVMRNTTERPEAVEAGTVLLVGTNEDLIVSKALELLNSQDNFIKMSKPLGLTENFRYKISPKLWSLFKTVVIHLGNTRNTLKLD